MCFHPKLSAKRENVVTLKDSRVTVPLLYSLICDFEWAIKMYASGLLCCEISPVGV